MDEVRCRVIVSGRVQGVAYRAACRSTAQQLGVRGWVRNRYDGTVEVAAEGTRDAVGRLVEWCRSGPSHARVTHVEIIDEPIVGEREFHVTY